MSPTKILVVHGNPGHPDDLKRLTQAIKLPAGFSWEFVDLSRGGDVFGILDKVAPTQGKLIALGFSFACFQLLRWARERKRFFDALIFVNPTLAIDAPVSGLKQALVGLPVIGNALLSSSAPKLGEEFIKKTFSPQAAPDADAARMRAYLNSGETWKLAMDRKVFGQNHPLEGSCKPHVKRLFVLRGADDVSVPWAPQAALLRKIGLRPVGVKVFAKQGHSLPWTFDKAVIDALNEEFHKLDELLRHQVATAKGLRIGYQIGEVRENNIVSYIESHVRDYPNRVAMRWVDWKDIEAWDGSHKTALPHKEVTFGQLQRMVTAVAGGLQKMGVTKGDRVIIFLPMGTMMYAAMSAVQRLGAIAVFLDSWARSNHLGASAACATPKAMISHKAAFDLIKTVPEFDAMPLRIIAGPGNDGSFSAQLEQLLQGDQHPDVVPVASEFTALITFTTGSSGTPKGANRTHRFLSAQHEALSQVIPYTEADLDMPAFPIFSLNNLASGVSTLLPAINLSAPSPRDAAAMTSQILHEKITCTTLSPSMLNGVSAYCLEQKITLPSLRRVVTGGAPISRDNVSDFKAVAPYAEIWVLYGSTEVEPMAHIEAVEMLSIKPDADPEIVEDGVNVGHISEDLAYKFIKIVREPIDIKKTSWAALEVPEGEVGEFIVTGDHVCRDYYNNEEAFYKSKILDEEGNVWHRTGDLARIDAKGYLWVVGRIHNVIERGDKYFFPVAAEVILKRLDAVRQGAFLALPDSKLGSRTAVVLELKEGTEPSAQLIAEVRRLFAKNKIPVDSLFAVEKIPMDPRHHSKVEYDVLRTQIAQTRDYLV